MTTTSRRGWGCLFAVAIFTAGFHVPAAAAAEKVAVNDTYSAVQGVKLDVLTPGLLANDSEIAPWTLITRPSHGTYTLGGGQPGAFTYVSEAAFAGTDQFTYCISSYGGGPCESNIATVEIHVLALVANDDAYFTAANSVLRVAAPGTTANDAALAAWSILTRPANGLLTLGGGQPGAFDYTPNTDFTGIDTFTYCLSEGAGGPCRSNVATVRIRVGGPVVERIGGADRYDVAAAVSARAHPGTASTVYVASGVVYSDALSAGPSAIRAGAALELVLPDRVPAATAAEITRLNPSRIVVVGGAVTVHDSVLAELRALPSKPTVERIDGVDRYAVSRAIATEAFGASSAKAWVVTGTNFPDALSASGAAGTAVAPVLLTNGPAATADRPTLDLLRSLGPSQVTIAGGTASVSTGVEESLKTVAPVTRAAGADRYEASVNVNRVFTTAATVYLAKGTNFPDALVGGVLAGLTRGPLYVVPPTCVPQPVLDEIARIGATKIVLLGSEDSLGAEVFNLQACA